ncbi:transcriptional regulator, partial [Candidatus Hodarchaeum mangrovi]
MHFICEMVPSYYLTPLRKIVAQKLSQHGLKQLEIAQVLGVSQPVVSSYLKEETILKSPLITRDSFKEFSEILIKQILEGASNQLTLMELICQECLQYRTAGPLCDVHRR